MKRLWISVKRGLIREPKHRLAMGECIWLFEYMLDIADWDTGIIHDWKDEAAAEDMQMPLRTLRDQRRKLEELNYILCEKKQYTQDIRIKNWTNPRDYTGEILNPKQGGGTMEPQSDTQSSTQDVTPTFNPNNQTSLQSLTEKEKQEANRKVDAILGNELPTMTIRTAVTKFFPFNVNWETKFAKEWLEWARNENITVKQIQKAAERWRSDKSFNWQQPSLKLIFEKWPALMGTQESPRERTETDLERYMRTHGNNPA